MHASLSHPLYQLPSVTTASERLEWSEASQARVWNHLNCESRWEEGQVRSLLLQVWLK